MEIRTMGTQERLVNNNTVALIESIKGTIKT
jgi:hypothetical protein